jgi:hypothetical protein
MITATLESSFVLQERGWVLNQFRGHQSFNHPPNFQLVVFALERSLFESFETHGDLFFRFVLWLGIQIDSCSEKSHHLLETFGLEETTDSDFDCAR